MRIAFVLGLALAFLRVEGFAPLEQLELRATDLRLIQRGTESVDPNVVIVAVDDASIAKVGRWPWPRPLQAKLLNLIHAAEPSVIGFDIVQSEATNSPDLAALEDKLPAETFALVRETVGAGADDDQQLATAIRNAGNVVVGNFFDFSAKGNGSATKKFGHYSAVQSSTSGRGELWVPHADDLVPNLPAIAEAAETSGYFNTLTGVDGFYRKVPLVLSSGDRFAMPLSLAMLSVHRPTMTPRIRFDDSGVSEVFLGNLSIPVAQDGQLLLNYRGRGQSFPHLSASEILDGAIDPAAMKDKLVLVGVTATAVADVRATPFDGNYPGVEIHATALDNILRADFLYKPREIIVAEVVTIFASVLLLGAILSRARGLLGLVAVAALLGAYLYASQALFLSSGVPLGIVYPTLAILLVYIVIGVWHYITEERQKRLTRDAFGRYLNPEMADQVSENPELLALGGEKRELTVLFSDIRGFTTISEGMQPEDLVELLNVYLGEMTDVIFDESGTLDKYIGDAIMAVWGAPLPRDDHAAAACRAAIGMCEHLAANTDAWVARGWPRIAAGIGLHTGDMVVGNMGSERHVSYTVIGDNVNLGARLEGLTKNYGAEIVISEATRQAAGEGFLTRDLDLVAVKGKSEAVRIYQLLGRSGHADNEALATAFEAALELYRNRKFSEARTGFETLLQRFPGDRPCELYIERCESFLASPPPADWAGVTVMDTK